MRAIEVALILVAAGCLPQGDLPPVPESARSMYLAVAIDDGRYRVLAGDVVDQSVTIPTILLDGERTIDAYFFGCSLEEFAKPNEVARAGLLEGVFLAPSNHLPRHPRPSASYRAEIRNGEIGDWVASDDELRVDLQLAYPCPKYSREPAVALPGVRYASAWIVGEETSILVGSESGEVYRVDEVGAELVRNDLDAVDVTKLDEVFYALIRSESIVEPRRGDSIELLPDIAALSFGYIERIRLRVVSEQGMIRLSTADGDDLLRAGTEGSWSDLALICESQGCRAGEARNVFLSHTPELGFVASTSNLGCLGTQDLQRFELPAQPASPMEPCETLGGLDHQDDWGLLASNGNELWRLAATGWEPLTGETVGLPSVGDIGAVTAEPSVAFVAGSAQVAALFRDGPLCLFPELAEGRTIVGIATSANGLFVVSHDREMVYASFSRQLQPLNTCSD